MDVGLGIVRGRDQGAYGIGDSLGGQPATGACEETVHADRDEDDCGRERGPQIARRIAIERHTPPEFVPVGDVGIGGQPDPDRETQDHDGGEQPARRQGQDGLVGGSIENRTEGNQEYERKCHDGSLFPVETARQGSDHADKQQAYGGNPGLVLTAEETA